MDLVTTHSQADFDGLASMVAARKLYPDSRLVLAGGAQDAVRNFLARYDLDIALLRDLDLTAVRRLVLVDTQDIERLEQLRPLWNRPDVTLHLYDHHGGHVEGGSPEKRAGLVVERVVVQPVGATVTVMLGQLEARGIELSPFEATVLAVGLYEETGSLTYGSTTPRDLEAGAALVRAGADLSVVSETVRKPIASDQVVLLNELLTSADTHYLAGRKILVTSSGAERDRGDVASVVEWLMRVEGIDAVLAAIPIDRKIELVGRSRHPDVDVSWVAREFGGGGHAAAAAATIKGKTLVEVRERVTALLLDRYRPTLLARDVMTAPVKTVTADTPVAEVGQAMTQAGVNVFPVLDARGRYVGLVDRETVQKALYHKLSRVPVVQVMRTDRYAAVPETPYHEVERQMLEGHQRFVPILVGPKVIGVITRTDLLRTLHDDVLRGARGRAMEPHRMEPITQARHRDMAGTLTERLPPTVASLLRAAGELGQHQGVHVYMVGGIVRDLLLGIANLDVDLVVEGDGIAFARQLATQQGARLKVHERFGTAQLVWPDGFKVDVATARLEYYEYPTALPTIEQSSIKKDLYRRDFTINTLAIRLNPPAFGQLIDFYGGERDLKDRIIRVLHSLSFVEDPTRMFRAVRFAVRFGFDIGQEARALIVGAVRMKVVQRLSKHRLTDELRLLLSEREPRAGLAILADLTILPALHPQLTWSRRLDALVKAAEEAIDWFRLSVVDRPMEAWVVYLVVLLDGLPTKAATAMLARVELSVRQRLIVRQGRFSSRRVLSRLLSTPAPSPVAVYRLLSGWHDEALLYVMAKCPSETAKRSVVAYLTKYRATRPLLTGHDLTQLGVPTGPLYRVILNRLIESRLAGEVVTADDERRAIQDWYPARGDGTAR